MRDESDSVLEAIDEAVRIGREARIPVEIWHFKAAGKNNWGRMPELIARVNQARAAGIDVEADTYAYRSEEHTSELQSLRHLVCRLLLEKKKPKTRNADC